MILLTLGEVEIKFLPICLLGHPSKKSEFFGRFWYPPLQCRNFDPDLPLICSYSNVTKVNLKMLLMKSSESDFIFLPAFYPIICVMNAPNNYKRIIIFKTLQQVSFWGVKITSANNPWNDTFSGINFFDCNQYFVVAFDPIKI